MRLPVAAAPLVVHTAVRCPSGGQGAAPHPAAPELGETVAGSPAGTVMPGRRERTFSQLDVGTRGGRVTPVPSSTGATRATEDGFNANQLQVHF